MARTFVALDLEMTGQDYERDEIIQIGAIKFDEERVLGRWSSLVRPTVRVPLRIRRLTGIRERDLASAPSFEKVQHRLLEFVGDLPLVGHSIGHDVRFLASKGLELGNPEYDTWELATLLMPSLPSYTLEGVAAALGVPAPSSHDAMADAETSRRVFLGLVEKLHELPQELVARIVALTGGTDWKLAPLFRSLLGSSREEFAPRAGSGTVRARLRSKGLSERDLASLVFTPPRRVPPLEPAREIVALDPEQLVREFEPQGELSGAFESYEYRPQQVEMMRAVVGALNDDRVLVVEAGTGTGKSAAYLVPAIHWAVQNGRRVVVSTDTINLQDQLYNKDIPDIRRAIGQVGRSLRATLVKGRSNYLCLRRWEEFQRSGPHSEDELRFVVKVLLWLPHTETGDVAELPLSQAERALWQRVCATKDTCTGRRCLSSGGRQCFLHRVRQEAEGSHLIIVNHALLLSDVAAGNTVLPEYEYLVIDEAHKLEEEATDQLSFALDQRSLEEHLDRISKPVSPDRHEGIASTLPVHLRDSRVRTEDHERVIELARALAERTDRARSRAAGFFAALGGVAEGLGAPSGYDQHLRLVGEVRAREGWQAVAGAWDDLKVALAELQAVLVRTVELFESFEGLNVADCEELIGDLEALVVATIEIAERTDWIVAKPREQDVCWLTLSARSGAISLHQAPLHVGPLLQEHLYGRKRSIVMTSATLSTDRSFAYVRSRLGLDDADELLLDSPFDYRSSALLLVAKDVPEPGSQGYQKAIEQALVDLVIAAEGRTLALFTSHSGLQATLKAVRKPLTQRDILVLAHGDGPRHRLLQQLKANPRTVLLGTRSFWEGIDVVGDALSLLVIARLPFEVPSDPVFTARSESFDDPFGQYALPQAILRLKQGFGRLIRSKTDRGVVVILDSRLLTRGYGGAFLRSLPPATIRKGPARSLPSAVAEWLSRPAATRTEATAVER